jgi:hypothetical protein
VKPGRSQLQTTKSLTSTTRLAGEAVKNLRDARQAPEGIVTVSYCIKLTYKSSQTGSTVERDQRQGLLTTVRGMLPAVRAQAH